MCGDPSDTAAYLIEVAMAHDANRECQCPKCGRLHRKLANNPPASIKGWECAAKPWIKSDPPQDCDWPTCGCDPQANKVIEALEESGALATPSPDAGVVEHLVTEIDELHSRAYDLKRVVLDRDSCRDDFCDRLRDIWPTIRAVLASAPVPDNGEGK